MFVQKEMIHAVSHELRTPVARIRFGVQMIEDCQNQDMLKKQIAGIDGDIQELDELIDEILTYARLEQGGPILTFQEDNVRAIVEQVVQEQSSVKPDLKIVAEFKPGSDKWKISEIETRYIHRSIQNLVGNATRYARSTVKVVCAFDQDTCRVDVEDDGPGVPEADWEKVFTPFARLDDSRTRSSGGYGLGLSIVRRILYWHGGQAFLGSSEMGGAKFSLVWPRKQEKHG
jgi:two-component system sensor histidine kinase RstB